MKKALLFALIVSTSVNAADFDSEYFYRKQQEMRHTQSTYDGMVERRIRSYTDALIIESVQEKCVRYIKFDFPRDRVIPNKQYFIMGFEYPMQQSIIAEAKIRAADYSNKEILRKNLVPEQVLTDSAWCRLVGPDLMQSAKEDLDFNTLN